MSRTHRAFAKRSRYSVFVHPWKADAFRHPTCGSVFTQGEGGEIRIAGREYWADPVEHPLGKRRLKREASRRRRIAGLNAIRKAELD